MFCGSLFVLFLLAIELFVLRFTASYYPFGFFKRFLLHVDIVMLNIYSS